MPMMELVLFGAAMGWIAPVYPLGRHWVNGAVLGDSFEWFVRTRARGVTGA